MSSRRALRAAALLSCWLICSATAGDAQDLPEIVIDPETAHREVVATLTEAAAYLPVGFALEAMEGTAVAVHRLAEPHPAQMAESDGGPVLLLSERSYFATGSMIDLADAAIDTVAHLFEALFERWASRGWLADPARRAALEDVAGRIYEDLPPEKRVEALIDAEAQYVGHLLSIAASIERSSRRGGDMCRKLDSPLLRLWARTGDQVEYAGAVWLDGGWRTSRHDLPPEQRAQVRRDALAGRWSGSPRRDFASRYCP